MMAKKIRVEGKLGKTGDPNAKETGGKSGFHKNKSLKKQVETKVGSQEKTSYPRAAIKKEGASGAHFY